MNPGSVFDDPAPDAAPDIERRLIEGYRAMSPAAKLARVASLNRALVVLAEARIPSQYGPDVSERELRLRVAALRLPRETMLAVFDWDPVEQGY